MFRRIALIVFIAGANGYQTFTTTIDLLSSGSTLDIKLQPSP